MKNIRKIIFSFVLFIILVVISVLCFIFGRGHTVYLDNKKIDNYDAYQYIDISYKGDNVSILGKEERTVISVIGQKCKLDLVVTKKRNSTDEEQVVTIELPYDMNDIVINLNSYLEGASEDVYLSKFVPLISISEEDTESEEIDVGDEFAMPTEE